MGRCAHLDTDEERLPEGMTRVGYDADSQIYTYRDSDGSYWEGAPGCRYGKLHRVRSATPPLPSAHIDDDDDDDETAYVLHDDDEDDSGEDEKKTRPPAAQPLPSSPTKTHPTTHHHHPVAGQPLPVLPNDDDAETDTLGGTTVRESIYSTADTITSTHPPPPLGLRYSDLPEPEQSHNHGQGLKRAGRLARIARFLSSSPSSSSTAASRQAGSSSSSPLSRRATVAGSKTPASRGGNATPSWPRARRVGTTTPLGHGVGVGDGWWRGW